MKGNCHVLDAVRMITGLCQPVPRPGLQLETSEYKTSLSFVGLRETLHLTVP